MSEPTIAVCARSKLSDGRPQFINELLAGSGFAVRLVLDDAPIDTAVSIVWILDNINWFPRLRRTLRAMPASRRPFVLVWHTEPLPLPEAERQKFHLLDAREVAKILLRDNRATDVFTNSACILKMAQHGIPDLLAVSTRSRQRYLAEKGIQSEFVPLGYYEYLGRDLGIPRDIDVLFLGVLSQRRHRQALDYLKGRGVRVKAAGGWDDPDCWGESRTNLINRSTIFLNLQRHPGKLSGQRMILGMANRSMVISEPIVNPEPYIPGRHFVSATLDEMPETIEQFLHDDAARDRIADAGHQFVLSELTMERSVETLSRLAGMS